MHYTFFDIKPKEFQVPGNESVELYTRFYTNNNIYWYKKKLQANANQQICHKLVS